MKKTWFSLFLEGFRPAVSRGGIGLVGRSQRVECVKKTWFSLFLEGFRPAVSCAVAESAWSGALGGWNA